jgi:hypothetical protein
MRKHRKLLISALLLALIATGAFLLYRHASGTTLKIVRLLPESDQLAYINLKPVRLIWDLSKSKPVELEGNYREFVDQTGIQFERDLDEAAVSWQERDTPQGRHVESASIFAGHFDPARLKSYLQKIPSQSETYGDLTIYSIPNQDHTLRVCVLDGWRIASTTSNSPDVIRGIIDRTHGSPEGPELLQNYYHHVPVGSLAWTIDRIKRGSGSSARPFTSNLSFIENTTTVASLRYNGSLLFRADIFAASDTEARQVMDSANAFLAIYGLLDRSAGIRKDADMKAALDSIRLEQKGSVVTVTASCPDKLLKKFQSELESEVIAAPASPAQTPPSRKR